MAALSACAAPQTAPALTESAPPTGAAAEAPLPAGDSPSPASASTATPTLQPAPSPTRTPLPCTDTTGSVLEESFVSGITGSEFNYRIFLPPCYAAAERRYPVLIMLHGLGPGMDDTQWDRMGLDEAAEQGIAQGGLAPLIIVMPDGNDADHAGYDGPSPFPEVVVQELMPHVQRHFCTWNEPDAWAIGGLSRGGFWAYYIAFSHPELFARVGGHSPYFYEPEFAAEKNPSNLVDSAPGIERLAMYMDHGPDDYDQVITTVLNFKQRLEARGIEPLHIVNGVGDHTEAYWSQHVSDYLNFYASGWPRSPDELPSCHAPSAGLATATPPASQTPEPTSP